MFRELFTEATVTEGKNGDFGALLAKVQENNEVTVNSKKPFTLKSGGEVMTFKTNDARYKAFQKLMTAMNNQIKVNRTVR